jgi:ketosteroid isomerase-like protein
MFAGAPGASVDSLDEIEHLLARWIDAETCGDTAALDDLLDDDFRGDGAHGFVLTKSEWLDRYRDGGLVHTAFTWHDVTARVSGDTAVVRGIQARRTRCQGNEGQDRSLGTLVALRRDGRWVIVNLQLGKLPEADGADGPE